MEHPSQEITEAVAAVAQESAHGAGNHQAHELPNLITVLHSKFPHATWADFLHQWENVLFSVAIGILIAFIFNKASRERSMIPKPGIANFIETIVEAFEDFVVGIMGERGRFHVPFIGTLFIYILLMNWSGLIPFLKSPTSSWNTTIALAVISVIYVHASGIRALGFGHYLHHLAGSPQGILPWLIGAVLIFPLNVVLELGAVPFSLSLRLFANISSEDSLLYNFAQLNASSHFIPILLQVFANCLALLFSMIQAFVFTLLTTVYISMLMPHEEHHHEAEGEGNHTHHAPSSNHHQPATH